jgi:parallel beta-helix repeat protein
VIMQSRLVLIAGVLSVTHTVCATTLTVDLNGEANYMDIQSAIDAAKPGDTVLVKPGEYTIMESIDFNRLHDVNHPGSPPLKNLTVKSDAGAEFTTIRMSEMPSNPARASVVTFESGEASDSILEGFTVTGGLGSANDCEPRAGGGILCMNDSSPTIIDCRIVMNSAVTFSSCGPERGGGGVGSEDSSPTLIGCTISGNTSPYGGGVGAWNSFMTLIDCTISGNIGGRGGGLLCSGSSLFLRNCTITTNSASGHGGGMACVDSSPILTHCEILENAARGTSDNDGAGSGGGVFCWNSSPTITDCAIRGNSAAGGMASSVGGGGLYCGANSSPIVTNCSIMANWCEALGDGGGVHCGPNSAPTITNSIICGNANDGFVSVGRCSGLHEEDELSCFGSSPLLVNCTVVGNWGGGISYKLRSSPVLKNCIVWGNSYGISEFDSFPEYPPGSPVISYSVIQGDPVWPGEGNINQNPLFVRQGHWEDCGATWQSGCIPESGRDLGVPTALRRWIDSDYHLLPGSPCIDTGTCDDAPPLDIEGNARSTGAGCEIGAYEFGSSPPRPQFHRGDPNSSGTTDISDGFSVFGHLFGGNPASLTCAESADSNNDGTIDISDGIYLLSWLFIGGPEPAGPGPTGMPCGFDPDPPGSPGDLGCESYDHCN